MKAIFIIYCCFIDVLWVGGNGGGHERFVSWAKPPVFQEPGNAPGDQNQTFTLETAVCFLCETKTQHLFLSVMLLM